MLPNTKRSKKEETRSQDYGLLSMTPIYGQVIQSAPSWNGPFEAPSLPTPVERPKGPSAISQWGGLAANLASTAGCAALTSSGIGMLACPLLGQGVGSFVSSMFQGKSNNDRSALYGAPSIASN
jgi:hypothetical protein